MFLKPNTQPKYAATLADGGKPNPNHEPDRVQLQVWDPARRDFLPPEGRDVGDDNALHWHRRIQHGEVMVLSAEDGAKSVADADKARAAALAAEQKKTAEAEKAAGKSTDAGAPKGADSK